MSTIKLEGTDEPRCPPVPKDVNKSPLSCASCGVGPDVGFVCTGCRSVRYCGQKCQKSHWKEHQTLCNTINSLTGERNKKIDEDCSFISHVTPRVRKKLIQLVGERCMIDCKIHNKEVEGLWDTGAQVSLVSHGWVSSLEGETPEIKSLESLVGVDEIDLRGAGGKKIPYIGYVMMEVKLKGRSDILDVPFLVTADDITNPIIGYNVIRVVAESDEDGEAEFFKDVSSEKVCEVMELLADPESDCLSSVKTFKTGTVVKKRSTSVITLKINNVVVDKRMPAIFDPHIESQLMFDGVLSVEEQLVTLKQGLNQKIKVSVVNRTNEDVEIPGRIVLGEINLISSITPVAVKLRDVSGEGVEDKDPEGSPDGIRDGSGECVKDKDPEGSPDGKAVRSEKCDADNIECECNRVEVKDESRYTKLKQQLQEMKMDDLDRETQWRVRDMLWSRRQAFCSDDWEIGEAEDLQMKINTTDEVPVQKHYYKIRIPMIEEVKGHVMDLLNRGFIKESKSPYSSPVVLVRKKGGGLRVCCDFRDLNRKTIPDKHPLPRIDDVLENLGGSMWFTVIDQSRAYYQGFIHPESRWKTAFVTPWGLYEWIRIPFGLMNAPAMFQRHMEETLREYRDKFALPYLDDAIIYSVSINDHIEHIAVVLDKFIEKGLKIGFGKCNFFQKEVKFLGRIVSREGYKMDESNVEAVRALKGQVAKTLGEVRQLLGLLGYHRGQIQDFAKIAKPLTELLKTKGVDANEKNTSKRPVVWLEEHKVALEKLVDAITSQPILAYPDYDEEFFIHTDASGLGLGCILYQMQKGVRRVIALQAHHTLFVKTLPYPCGHGGTTLFEHNCLDIYFSFGKSYRLILKVNF